MWEAASSSCQLWGNTFCFIHQWTVSVVVFCSSSPQSIETASLFQYFESHNKNALTFGPSVLLEVEMLVLLHPYWVFEILGLDCIGLRGPFHYLGALFLELESVTKPTLKPLVPCDTLKPALVAPSSLAWDLQLTLKDSWSLFLQMHPVKCHYSSADIRRSDGSEREGQLYIPTELFCTGVGLWYIYMVYLNLSDV